MEFLRLTVPSNRQYNVGRMFCDDGWGVWGLQGFKLKTLFVFSVVL